MPVEHSQLEQWLIEIRRIHGYRSDFVDRVYALIVRDRPLPSQVLGDPRTCTVFLWLDYYINVSLEPMHDWVCEGDRPAYYQVQAMYHYAGYGATRYFATADEALAYVDREVC